MSKKTISFILTLMIFIMGLTTFGIVGGYEPENDTNNKITVLSFENAINDIDKWMYSDENTKHDAGLLQIIGSETRNIIGYEGEKYKNELLHFNIKMEIENGWQGFHIRSTNTSSLPWKGNDGYLIVIKPDIIELQKWQSSGQEVLQVIPNNNNILDQKWHKIIIGAVNVEEGVHIVLFVDGKVVLNYFDKIRPIVGEGYFCIYAGRKNVTLKAQNVINTDIEPIVLNPIIVTDSGSNLVRPKRIRGAVVGTATIGSILKGNYDFIDINGNLQDDSEFRWLISDTLEGEIVENDFIKKIKNLFPRYKEYKYNEIQGARERTYVVKPEDQGKYIKFEVISKTKGENELNIAVQSRTFFIDALAGKMTDSIFLRVGSTISYVDGIETDIFKNDALVVPLIKEGTTLVPVRFISESFGADVGWDGDTSEITVKLNDKTIKMFLGSKKIIINGKENTLDVPAQTIKDRTIIPLRALVEALGKNVFWDDRGLIVISNEENLFDIEKEMDLIDEAIELFSY